MGKYKLENTESHQYDNEAYVGSKSELTGDGGGTSKKRTRYILLIVIFVVCLTGLAVGLGVGLSKKSSNAETGTQAPFLGGNISSTPTTITKETTTSGNKCPTTVQPKKRLTTMQPATDWLSYSCMKPADTHRPSSSCPWRKNPVLLVSLDGFRADYLLRNLTPVIQKLRTCGVHTPYMRAVYPTLTFPNHYTIVTGLYPESHGIVGNNMYDPTLNKSFSLGRSEKFDPRWWGGEPLWSTAKKQCLRTASYFWVGSDVNISGIQPDIWERYNGGITFEKRVDTVLDWLSMPEGERPDFITLYFDQPDHAGHHGGPNSAEVNDALAEVDMTLGRLMDGLMRYNIQDCVNLIVIADHGMESVSCQRQVALKNYMRVDDKLIFGGTTGHVNPHYHKLPHHIVTSTTNVTNTDAIIGALQCKDPHLDVFTRETIPKRHHYTNNARIGEVVLDVAAKWLVYDKHHSYCNLKGNHGYDNIYKSMHALFLAHGPAFKQNFTATPFENIELYNLMSELLGITPAPNNGTFGSLHEMLKQPLEVHKYGLVAEQCEGAVATAPSDICNCANYTGVDMEDLITDNATNHVTFGEPRTMFGDDTCVLYQAKSTTGYSRSLRSPVWTSGIVAQGHNNNTFNQACIVEDPRAPGNAINCSSCNMDISLAPLFMSGAVGHMQDVYLSSEVVPMYDSFKTGIWTFMWDLISDYASQYGTLSVTTGPIYDYNYDGLWEGLTNDTRLLEDGTPIPTHIYVIIARCPGKTQTLHCEHRLNVLSFIIPHVQNIPNCLREDKYIKDNVARIRDIELLTGLTFMTELPSSVAIPLRTFLPESIWPTLLIKRWIDTPCPTTATCKSQNNPVLLVSLDGFRADYLLRNLTPVIQKLRTCGVHTPYMRAVYPTLTFPNHYTIVTGLYPESHGIVGNSMYDPTLNKSFSLGGPEKYDPRWWGGEPLWITAKKHHKRTASYFWVGSDVNISGIQPDIWKKYDGTVTFQQRVDTVIDWLVLPQDKRPDFITLYFDQPDHAGHGAGPDSEDVNIALEEVDAVLGRLMDGLMKHNIQDCVNIIVIADHGMESTSCDRQVGLDRYMSIKDKLIFGGTTGHINPHYRSHTVRHHGKVVTATAHAASDDDIIGALQCKDSHLDVFTRDTIPKRHHYTNNARIGDVVIDVAAKWLVYGHKRKKCLSGNHGYDNIYKSMHALFLAHGPAFKQNFTAKPFENIELYNLMAELLGIEPAPNNGTFGSLHSMLNNTTAIKREGDTVGQCNTSTVDLQPPTCSCSNDTDVDVGELFTRNSTGTMALGEPRETSGDSICILHQAGATLGYSDSLRSPIWATIAISHPPANITGVPANQTCIVTDSRIPGTATNCSTYQHNISLVPLFDAGIVGRTNDVYLSSEVIPMYADFQTGIWTFIWELISDYASQYGPLSVTTGPIYDYNYDGLWEGLTNGTLTSNDDIPIPTHIYVIIVRCQESTDQLPCGGKLEILPFIIPHVQEIPNCLEYDKYLKDNVARIRDIELLTGLTFMTTFDPIVAVPLRTFLPENIWQSTLIKRWIDIPCPRAEMCRTSKNPVLLVSLDGFRADYLLRNITPVIQKLRTCGVHTPYMRAVYPTLTFPNHYTIVTGLYPESHGIVGNHMYDPTINKLFSISGRAKNDPRWWGGEPLWVTAKKQKKRTASYFWVGSEVNISGIQPDIWERYSSKISFEERVDTVLKWMTQPEHERPDFITLYFNQPDHAAHGAGPDSEEVNVALRQVDNILGRLMDGLMKHNLQDCVNLIVIADHGMEATSCQRQVDLDNYMTVDDKLIFGGTTGHINSHYHKASVKGKGKVVKPTVNATSTDDIIGSLQCKDPHLDVFTRDTIAKRHHYTNNIRIGDVVLDVAAKWLVYDRHSNWCLKGNHGYDNIYKSMHALFFAHGPAFKHNFTADPFENIELYNMMSELLGIVPAPNNGTTGSLHSMLIHPYTVTTGGYGLSQCNVSTNGVPAWQCGCAAEIHVDLEPMFADNMTKNVTFGEPRAGRAADVCVLYQAGSATGYSRALGSPVWTTVSISPPQDNATRETSNDTCISEDPRVSEGSTAECSRHNSDGMTLVPLFQADLAGRVQDMYLSSEVVPMYDGFKHGVWTFIWDLISDYAIQYGPLSVTTGPIYDYNYDGLWEGLTNDTGLTSACTPVPTHIYVIIVGCRTRGDNLPCDGDIDIMSFILPHVQEIPNCLTKEKYLRDNVARIRDIELLTDVTFMTAFNPEVTVPWRTFLPEAIWPTSL